MIFAKRYALICLIVTMTAVSLMGCRSQSCGKHPSVRLEAGLEQDRLDVFAGDALFTSYKFAPDQKYPWFTRDYGFFSPTPMYWLEEDSLMLPAGEALTLRYRVIVHAGGAEEADINGLFEEYAKSSLDEMNSLED